MYIDNVKKLTTLFLEKGGTGENMYKGQGRGEHRAGPDPIPTKPESRFRRKTKPTPDPNRNRDGRDISDIFVDFLCCFSVSIPSRPETDRHDSRLAGKHKPTPDPNRNRDVGWTGSGREAVVGPDMLSPTWEYFS